jgi:hypothetical protein
MDDDEVPIFIARHKSAVPTQYANSRARVCLMDILSGSIPLSVDAVVRSLYFPSIGRLLTSDMQDSGVWTNDDRAKFEPYMRDFEFIQVQLSVRNI